MIKLYIYWITTSLHVLNIPVNLAQIPLTPLIWIQNWMVNQLQIFWIQLLSTGIFVWQILRKYHLFNILHHFAIKKYQEIFLCNTQKRLLEPPMATSDKYVINHRGHTCWIRGLLLMNHSNSCDDFNFWWKCTMGTTGRLLSIRSMFDMKRHFWTITLV